METKTVLCDGEPFEYDVVMPISEVEALLNMGVVDDVSVGGTGLGRELYLAEDDKGRWAIFGTDGRKHSFDPSESAYVVFINTDAIETKLAIKKRNIREAMKKYGQ